MEQLRGADKKQDLLDMELETAEKQIEELSKNCKSLQEKLDVAAKEKELESQLKSNSEQVIKDLEHSLERETERAEDFKVK